MFDIDELIKILSKSNVTINVFKAEKEELDTDFSVGDRVYVCHTKSDGTGTKHTQGVVDSIDEDEFGPYVRVTGDNGKHYKCGLKMDEVRKGSKIFDFVD